jgi:hypothetical protein
MNRETKYIIQINLSGDVKIEHWVEYDWAVKL